MKTFKPYKTLILVPAGITGYRGGVTVLFVEYYAPGCWRALQKTAEFNSYMAGASYIQKAQRTHDLSR